MSPSVNRRHVLGGIGATLAGSLKLGAQATVPGPPEIQLDMSIDLDKDEVYSFLLSSNPDMVFDPVLTPSEKANYAQVSTKSAGTQALPDPKAAKGTAGASGLLTAKRLTYFVRKHGIVIGEVKAIDIYTNPVLITVNNVLFIANSINATSALFKKIRDAFDAYDPTNNPDPLQYAYQRMGSDVKPEMFMVRTSYSLHKTSTPTPVQKQSEFIEDFYKGKVKVHFYNAPGKSLNQYLEDERLSLSGPKEEDLGRVPKPRSDVHVKEIPDTPPPSQAQEDQAANDVVDGIVTAVQGSCVLNAKEVVRIAAIFGWPEFKVDWVPVKIQIGCVWVIFSLPVLRIRFSALVLYAYIAHSNELGQDVVTILVGCLWRSIAAGAIVGLVAGADLAVALEAFEVLFTECVTYQVTCALPGLALVVESSSWS